MLIGGKMGEKNDISILDIINPFATQALLMMGAMKIPNVDAKVDLKEAKRAIDTLHFIKEKMKNNLSEEEEKHLDDIIMSVQMSFVEMNKKENSNTKEEEK